VTSDPDREALIPGYLRGVLTVEAELSDGHIGTHGWMHTDNMAPVLVALSYADGMASLVTEDGNGQLTRLRIPGQAFLRLIDQRGAEAGDLTRAACGAGATAEGRPVRQ